MSKSFVSIDFSTNNFTDQNLYVRTQTIIGNLTDNVTYVSLAADVLTLKTKNDYFGGYLSKMADGNKLTTSEKKAARKDLEDFLHVVGGRVQDISGGNESLILSSGFDLKRKSTPVGMLDMPTNVAVAQGKQNGSMDITWDVVNKAYLYLVRYTTAPSTPTSVWVQISTSKHKATLTGMTPGQGVAIQVAAAGSDSNLVWSFEVVAYCMF